MKLHDLQTPVLLIRMDRVRGNLARMSALLGPHGGLKRWRPHLKTAKVPAVQRLLIEAGVTRFKCATTREAAVAIALADGMNVALDLLVAMAHRGANLQRVAELAAHSKRHRLSILTEDVDHARSVLDMRAGLGLFVDLDPRFRRTGIPLAERGRIRAVVQACGPLLRGLHCYEGHVKAATSAERRAQCRPLFDELASVAQELELARHETVTSGTPTFVEALEHPGLQQLHHRVSPGIVVYWDLDREALGIGGFRCAASVLARVISAPRAGRVTLDAGSKALDAAVGDPCVQALGLDARAEKPSEEHLPLEIVSGRVPAPGDLVELLPRHVCPMINLADEAALLEGDEVFRIVRVDARGHEVLTPQRSR
jgi:D-serine deaminase-like pyridoxal phosphate-dependent protein